MDGTLQMTKVTVRPIQAKAVINRLGIQKGGRTHKHITNEIYRLSAPYTPRKTGALYMNVTMDMDGGGYTHNVPYARKHWYDLQGANFRGAPLRGSEWAIRSFNDNKVAIERSAEAFMKRGG